MGQPHVALLPKVLRASRDRGKRGLLRAMKACWTGLLRYYSLRQIRALSGGRKMDVSKQKLRLTHRRSSRRNPRNDEVATSCEYVTVIVSGFRFLVSLHLTAGLHSYAVKSPTNLTGRNNDLLIKASRPAGRDLFPNWQPYVHDSSQ